MKTTITLTLDNITPEQFVSAMNLGGFRCLPATAYVDTTATMDDIEFAHIDKESYVTFENDNITISKPIGCFVPKFKNTGDYQLSGNEIKLDSDFNQYKGKTHGTNSRVLRSLKSYIGK